MKIAGNLISDIERDSSCPSRFAGTCARAPAPLHEGKSSYASLTLLSGIVASLQTIPGNPAKLKKIMQDKVTDIEGLALEPSRGPTPRSSWPNLSLSFRSFPPFSSSSNPLESSQDGKLCGLTAATAFESVFWKCSKGPPRWTWDRRTG